MSGAQDDFADCTTRWQWVTWRDGRILSRHRTERTALKAAVSREGLGSRVVRVLTGEVASYEVPSGWHRAPPPETVDWSATLPEDELQALRHQLYVDPGDEALPARGARRRRAPRTPGGTVRTTITAAKGIMRRAESEAERRGVTLSAVVAEVLDEGLPPAEDSE